MNRKPRKEASILKGQGGQKSLVRPHKSVAIRNGTVTNSRARRRRQTESVPDQSHTTGHLFSRRVSWRFRCRHILLLDTRNLLVTRWRQDLANRALEDRTLPHNFRKRSLLPLSRRDR